MSEELGLQVTVRYSESIVNLSKALIAAQPNYKPIVKDKLNPHTRSKYADLADVIAATLPALNAEGLTIIQPCIIRGKSAGTLARLVHISGEYIENEVLLPTSMPGKDEKFDAQSIGSAFTYSRRYSWNGLSGAVAEADDDGNAASGRDEDSRSQSEQPRRSNPKPAPPVNQNPAKTGGSKPGDTKPAPAKAVEPSQNAQGSPQTNEKPSGAPVLPSAADLDAVAKEQEIAASTAKSAVSENPEPDRIADSGAKPDKTAFDAYVARAIALKQPLEKVGLKPSKGLQTGAKIKNNLLASAGAKELADLTVSQWEAWLGVMEPLAKTNPSNAVEVIEGGK